MDVRGSKTTGTPLRPAGPGARLKDKVTDRQKKVKNSLVLSSEYSVLSDDEMESSSVLPN